MASRIAHQINEWPTVPTATGHDGLRSLAAEDFTGVVQAGDAEAAFVNGRIVGIFGGTLEAFAGRSLTSHEAPHMALPLLYTMQRQNPAPRAQYYTAETPLADVDQTLAEGFTGFVELSENVLSGDYYIVYYGGRSLSIAFLGESDRLVTDEDAFDRAASEVGIYEVFDADVTVHELPEPVETTGTDSEAFDAEDTDAAPTPEPTDSTDNDEAQPERTEAETPPETADSQPVTVPEPPADTGSTEGQIERGDTPESTKTTPSENTEPDRTTPTTTNEATLSAESKSGDTETAAALDDAAVTRIPALDPDRTKESTDASEPQQSTGTGSTVVQATKATQQQENTSQQLSALRRKVESLQSEREELKDARDAAKQTITELKAENERLKDRVADLTEENEQLQDRITALEREQTSTVESQPAGRQLTPDEALAQTALFFRYNSKGAATLEDVDSAEAAAINENLLIDFHTQFDTGNVRIDEQPFEVFIEASIEHRFLSWLLRELVYEIRDTGSQSALGDLYEAIPRIDRVQFHERIDLPGELEQDAVSFDCVAYDRVGEPLFVVQFNDTREPATEAVVAELSKNATAAAKAAPSIGAAFYVTASFFEPEALETASASTGGGLLSRDARKSHVKVSRKQGYHLCLVEARDQGLNLTLPDL